MKPYFEKENIKLYQCDNLELLKELPDNYIKVIYIDSPFSVGRDFKTKDGQFAFSDKYTLEELTDYLKPRIEQIYRVLREDGSFYIHGDNNYIHNLKVECDKIFGFNNYKGDIIWYRYNKIPNKTKKLFFKMHDTILHYTKSDTYTFNAIVENTGEIIKRKKMKKNNGKITTINEYIEYEKQILLTRSVIEDIPDICIGNSKEITGYPTQKPVKLIERLIIASSNENDIIADFFMGSCSTGEAALKLNRKFIGCDIGDIACKISKERLIKILK